MILSHGDMSHTHVVRHVCLWSPALRIEYVFSSIKEKESFFFKRMLNQYSNTVCLVLQKCLFLLRRIKCCVHYCASSPVLRTRVPNLYSATDCWRSPPLFSRFYQLPCTTHCKPSWSNVKLHPNQRYFCSQGCRCVDCCTMV